MQPRCPSIAASFRILLNDDGAGSIYRIVIRLYADADGVADGNDLYDLLLATNAAGPLAVTTDSSSATWHGASDTFAADGSIPSGHRLILRLSNAESSAGAFWAGYDRWDGVSTARLVLSSVGLLFLDGFESGTTGRW